MILKVCSNQKYSTILCLTSCLHCKRRARVWFPAPLVGFFSFGLVPPSPDWTEQHYLCVFSKRFEGLWGNKEQHGFIARTWVGTCMPWQAMGRHGAILEGAKSAQIASENCMEERKTELAPFCPQRCLRAVPRVNWPQARWTCAWWNHLSAFRNMMDNPGRIKGDC